MFFRMLYDDKLAQASYLIGCQRTGEAVVIDPQRDVERYISLADAEGLRITAITETHIHADFLSGARELAEVTGGRLYLSGEGGPDWQYRWLDMKKSGGTYDHKLVNNGDTIKVGNINLEVVHTPGHTPEHVSFMVTDQGGGATEPMGIATGDFVFVGDVGRPDLLETAAGQAGAKEESARILFDTIQSFKHLPDYLQLWPGHGAGSACGKALGAVPQSTVGYEKRFNASITLASDKDVFVKSITHGQPEPPLYFARMKRENRDGPALLGIMPEAKPVEIQSVIDAVRNGAALLDTRSWQEFSIGHIPGALYSPLDNSFPTVAGSYVNVGEPIYLLVDEGRVKEAVTDLIRIGLDEVAGYITPQALAEYSSRQDGLQSSKQMPITQLKTYDIGPNELVLDVRRRDEYDEGHLKGSINIAHTRLLDRLDEVPQDKSILVHCRTNNRSAYAAALLQKRGFDVTFLDGGIQAWLAADGKVVKEESAMNQVPEYE